HQGAILHGLEYLELGLQFDIAETGDGLALIRLEEEKRDFYLELLARQDWCLNGQSSFCFSRLPPFGVRQPEFEFTLNDRTSGQQRVKEGNVGFGILGIGWCDGATHQERQPDSSNTHMLLLRVCGVTRASLGYDAALSGFLV